MDFDEVIDRRGTYCTQWDYVKDRFGKSDLLPFTISDTDFALPDPVIEELTNRLKHPVMGYTRWNHDDFKGAVIKWYKKRFGIDIDSKWIVYSPSVMYSISQLIQLNSKEGQGVIVQTPGYDAFFKTIEANRRLIVENNLLYQNYSYSIDWEDLEEKIKDPNNAILLLCSPHNPTGRVWEKEELLRLVELCDLYDVYIVSDEIHMDIVRSGYKHIPLSEVAESSYAIVTSGSKTFNFPGLIFSYAIIPDAKDRDAFLYCLKNKDGLSSSSILGMHATMAAYNECGDWVDELNNYIDSNLKYVESYITDYIPGLKTVFSEATYLAWIDVSDYLVNNELEMSDLQRRLIDEGGLAIMDGSIYRGNGDSFLRLNVGAPFSKIEDGLERLKEVLTN